MLKHCFNIDYKKAAFLAACAATEKHGTFYDHTFFMVNLCPKVQREGMVIKNNGKNKNKYRVYKA